MHAPHLQLRSYLGNHFIARLKNRVLDSSTPPQLTVLAFSILPPNDALPFGELMEGNIHIITVKRREIFKLYPFCLLPLAAASSSVPSSPSQQWGNYIEEKMHKSFLSRGLPTPRISISWCHLSSHKRPSSQQYLLGSGYSSSSKPSQEMEEIFPTRSWLYLVALRL